MKSDRQDQGSVPAPPKRAVAGSVIRVPTPEGCPVAIAAARVAQPGSNAPTERIVSGWGATVQEAQARCCWEAVERYSAQVFPSDRFACASAAELGERGVSPEELILISPDQYATRDEWNAKHAGFNELPMRWHADRRIEWVEPSESLSTSLRSLPAGLCFLGHAADRSAGLPPADSNGLAAGPVPDGAAARAFFELVERDAAAMWWYNRITRPALDHADLAVPMINEYSAWTGTRGRSLRLFDLTHDLGVPVVAAASYALGGEAPALGFGAGRTTPEASEHAVGELAQFEANVALIEAYVATHGEEGLQLEAAALLAWRRAIRLAEQPQLTSSSRAAPATLEAQLDISWCRDQCARRGLALSAVDLSRSVVGGAVVRVVVPGLRPLWARFAAGRLFDVPVRLGWRSTAIHPGDLNPVPLAF